MLSRSSPLSTFHPPPSTFPFPSSLLPSPSSPSIGAQGEPLAAFDNASILWYHYKRRIGWPGASTVTTPGM